MPFPLFEFDRAVRARTCLRHDQDIVHDLPDLHLGDTRRAGQSRIGSAEAHPAHQIFGIEHADDMFGAALRIVDRNPGVLLIDTRERASSRVRSGGQREDPGRATMTWRAVMLSSSRAFQQHLFLRAEKAGPNWRAAVTISLSSSGEWTDPGADLAVPEGRRTKPAGRGS